MGNNIVVVGNSPTVQNTNDFVDSCDRVIRFSQGVGRNIYSGSKTTDLVLRTYCEYTDELLEKHPRTIAALLDEVTTVYFVYGFYASAPSVDGGRVLHIPNTMPYDDRIISRLGRQLNGFNVVPVPAGDSLYIHPAYPTTGFMFLLWLLRSNVFAEDKIYLAGFDLEGKEINKKAHAPDWEKEIVEEWIRRGYFHKAPIKV